MKNEYKLGLIIGTIALVAFGFGKAFQLSLNPETFQIGYTVYSENGKTINGFIPEKRNLASESTCNEKCDDNPSPFAMQCREAGHKVYSGPCCQSLCSANLAASSQGQPL